MNSKLRILSVLLGATATLLTPGCPNATTDTDDSSSSSSLAIRMQADYDTSAVTGSSQSAQVAQDGCAEEFEEDDSPGSPAGEDCDGDGAAAEYITPSSFLVAVKRMTLLDADGNEYEIVAEAATLAESEVVDLTNPTDLTELDLPAAVYSSIEAEIYYYELVMPLNDPPATHRLRVYLSDDDFEAEGNLGHHQGDITLLDEERQELGFVPPGEPWTIANLLSDRGDTEGAGGTDPETGHLRGLYGDTLQWNQDAFMQGAEQDVFLETIPFSIALAPREGAGPPPESITIVFNVADSWFYEDFDGDGNFDPCSLGPGVDADACAGSAAWSPVLPVPEVVAE